MGERETTVKVGRGISDVEGNARGLFSDEGVCRARRGSAK